MKDALLGPSRNTLMVVGHADEQELLNKVGELFANLPRNENLRPMPTPIAPEGHGQTVVEIREDAGATTLGFGWPSPAFGPDLDVLQVIAELVGGPEGARTVTSDLKDDQVVFRATCPCPCTARTPCLCWPRCPAPSRTKNRDARAERLSLGYRIACLGSTTRKPWTKPCAGHAAVERMVNGQANDVAEALSEGIKCGQVIAPWLYEQRFANMTPDNVRDVAGRLLTENNVTSALPATSFPNRRLWRSVQPYTSR